MRGTVPALVVIASWVATPAWAIDPQYRKVTLVDGRTLTAEIVSTEPEGLLLRVPQGDTLISFELLLDMVPISQAEYASQPPWVVYYWVPPEIESDTLALLAAIPGIEPQAVTVPGNGVTNTMALQATACDGKIACIATAVSSSSWKWVVTAEAVPTGGHTLKSKVNTSAGAAVDTPIAGKSDDELWEALHVALDLKVPPGGAPRSSSPEDTGPAEAMSDRKIVAWSFVPFPGAPSLAQRDASGFALALAVVVPSTAVWVGAIGQTGQSAPEFGALSFAGYYAVTVLANQVAGFRSVENKPVGLTAMPTPHGTGGVLVLAGEL